MSKDAEKACYTPGPWNRDAHELVVRATNGRLVADCGGIQNPLASRETEPESAANARLIQYAPHMIMALQLCVEALEATFGGGSHIAADAKEVLQKATGTERPANSQSTESSTDDRQEFGAYADTTGLIYILKRRVGDYLNELLLLAQSQNPHALCEAVTQTAQHVKLEHELAPGQIPFRVPGISPEERHNADIPSAAAEYAGKLHVMLQELRRAE
jgi:hypothetical protein